MDRLWNIADAVSQLFQVTFAPRARDTSANESLSGRSHREGWRWLERAIDLLCWWDTDGARGHCALADERDYIRAKRKVMEYEARNARP